MIAEVRIDGRKQPFRWRVKLGCIGASFVAAIWFPSHGIVQLLITLLGAAVVAFALMWLLKRLLWPVWHRAYTFAQRRNILTRFASVAADAMSGVAVTVGFLLILFLVHRIDIRVVPDYVGWPMMYVLMISNMGAWLAIPTALVVSAVSYFQDPQ